jgi:hypothetical protein
MALQRYATTSVYTVSWADRLDPPMLFVRSSLLGLIIAVAAASTVPISSANAAEQFNDLQCKIEFVDKDICNVSFFKRFLSVRMLKSGSAERILYKDVVRWSYENASLRKRSSIITTRVEHIHVFTIVYRDKDLGEYRTLVIDFDDITNVPPMKALLNDILPEAGPNS